MILFVHPARFILVGTMNPEEGELRPQLLDRFALSVDIIGIRAARERVSIMFICARIHGARIGRLLVRRGAGALPR